MRMKREKEGSREGGGERRGAEIKRDIRDERAREVGGRI